MLDAGEAILLEVVLIEQHPKAALELQGRRIFDDGSLAPVPEYAGVEVTLIIIRMKLHDCTSQGSEVDVVLVPRKGRGHVDCTWMAC